jgi:hemoglobin
MRAQTSLSLLFFLLLACSNKGDVKPTEPLFKRLGGKNAIEAVVLKMLDHVKADGRINGKFANADLEGLKTKLVDQICAGAGGPCQYTGKDMKTAHVGMGITDAEFGAMVEDLQKALDDLKVGAQEKADLIALLAPMKTDIVEGGNPPGPGQGPAPTK